MNKGDAGKKRREGPRTTKAGGYKPVLGLADTAEGQAPAADWREWAGKTVPGTVFDQPEPEKLIELTVIVPARNEEDCLATACNRSSANPKTSSSWARIGS